VINLRSPFVEYNGKTRHAVYPDFPARRRPGEGGWIREIHNQKRRVVLLKGARSATGAVGYSIEN